MPPTLVALAGPLQGRSFELGDEPVTLGRHASNAVCIRQLSVSRRHCVVEPEDGGFRLSDLGSRHGTFVNRRAVTRRHLAGGDLVTVGESLFRFLAGGDPAAGDDGLPVELSESRLDDASTVRLAPGDVLLTHPEKFLATRPAPARLEALQALLGISRAVHALHTPAELGGALLDELFHAVPAERGALLLHEPGGGPAAEPGVELAAVATRVQPPAAEEFEVSHTAVRRVSADGAGMLSNEVPRELETADSLRSRGVRSLLCVPVTHRQTPLGVLYLDTCNPGASFDRDHLELVTAAAAIAAAALDNARRVARLEAERRRLAAADLRHDLVGESPAMERILRLIARVAPTASTVLVTGESGCGKELVARALHANSPRADGPFIAVDCATLSETLLESELFGHEKGAFTGAAARRVGKFELADGGTLFLDEVGEIPPPLQAKLLRVLQEREIERLGGRRPIAIDVRLIAATNRDLRAAVEGRGFRHDLYHRLNVIEIPIPPLRRRRVDVPLLACHFLHLHGRALKRPAMALSPEARSALVAYDWPGNVRELSNAIERAVVLAEDPLIRPEDLPDAVIESRRGEVAGAGYHEAVNRFKGRLIVDAVAGAGGNVTRAAERLGLSRNYLHRLIKNLGLRPELDRE